MRRRLLDCMTHLTRLCVHWNVRPSEEAILSIPPLWLLHFTGDIYLNVPPKEDNFEHVVSLSPYYYGYW